MKKTHTPEQASAIKERFNFLKEVGCKGRSQSLTSPFSGKNKSQRIRLKSGFDATWMNKKGGSRIRFLTK